MEQGRLHLGQRGYSAVLVVVGLLYLLLEHNTTPTLLDDVVYRFQFTASGGMPPEPIQNLGDVLRSQYWHYLTINGRAPAHVLAQTFLTLVPGQVLNVLNALLFMLLIDGGGTTHCAAEGRQGGLRRPAGRNNLRPATGLPGGVAMAAGHAQLPLADRPPSLLSTLIEKTTAASPYLG